MTKQEALRFNTSTLAYLGDAVFEVIIREKIVREKSGDTDRAHHTAVRYVSAAGQAAAAKSMIASGFLTDERERLREIAAEAVRIVDVQSKRAAMQTNAGRK